MLKTLIKKKNDQDLYDDKKSFLIRIMVNLQILQDHIHVNICVFMYIYAYIKFQRAVY